MRFVDGEWEYVSDAIGRRLASRPGSMLVVHDRADFLAAYLDQLLSFSRGIAGADKVHAIAIDATASVADVGRVCAEWERWKPSLVVGLGGGSVIDTVKVARAAGLRMLDLESLESVEQCVVATPIASGTSQLLLVSSRLGSGSGWTPRAVIRNSVGISRLLYIEHRPAPLSLLSETLCASLPTDERVLDAIEIVSRAVGPFLDSMALSPMHIEFVERWLEIVDEFLGASGPVGEMAALSSASQRPDFTSGAGPYDFRLWLAVMAAVDRVYARKSAVMALALPVALDSQLAAGSSVENGPLNRLLMKLNTLSGSVELPSLVPPSAEEIYSSVGLSWPGATPSDRTRAACEVVASAVAKNVAGVGRSHRISRKDVHSDRS